MSVILLLEDLALLLTFLNSPSNMVPVGILNPNLNGKCLSGCREEHWSIVKHCFAKPPDLLLCIQ